MTIHPDTIIPNGARDLFRGVQTPAGQVPRSVRDAVQRHEMRCLSPVSLQPARSPAADSPADIPLPVGQQMLELADNFRMPCGEIGAFAWVADDVEQQ